MNKSGSNSISRPSANSGLLNETIESVHEGSSLPLDESSISMRNSSFREQKKNYNIKKRHLTQNIQSAIETLPEVHSGWLKARTNFKRWTKVWCQVKPGYLILYTSQEAQKKHRLGVVILSICQAIKRPTKKDGFCFKLTNPFKCSVWAKLSTIALAFSQSSLTLRASDAKIGKLWLDALQKCNLSLNLEGCCAIQEGVEATEDMDCNQSDISDSDDGANSTRQLDSLLLNASIDQSTNNSLSSLNIQPKHFLNGSKHSHLNNFKSSQQSLSSRHCELRGVDIASRNESRHNNEQLKTSHLEGLDNLDSGVHCFDNQIRVNENNNIIAPDSRSNLKMVVKMSKYNWKELQLENVAYVIDGNEELGSAGIQTEEMHEGNKSLLWHIIKQLRVGMDLSRVPLPTFILEPRSFLEKLADYYYHCDILAEAVQLDDPLTRFIHVVKWYLSGFYKKPKGPKKPYNPLLGERFRCFWDHPKTQSRTFFVAEQVSHHPPISAFHVSNKKDGYILNCSILSRSKYTGNSVSAIFDGKAKLTLTRRNETYTMTLPYANCRGILLGSLCFELGGKVEIDCFESGYRCELDFKLASVWANSNSYNALTGKIYQGNKVTHTLEGHWDKKINIIDKQKDEKSTLWEVTDAVRNSRLKRYTVAIQDQGERESVKLWTKVSQALATGDQTVATSEKTRLEDMQRREARERKAQHIPGDFVYQPSTDDWTYRWRDARSWDDKRDILQFEDDFKIRTLVINQGSTQTNFDPVIDLPLSQVNKVTDNVQSVARDPQTEGIKVATQDQSTSQQTEDTFKSLFSKMDAENLIIKQALQQISERSKKLEEDLASVNRNKKTVAMVVAVVIAMFLSLMFRYLS